MRSARPLVLALVVVAGGCFRLDPADVVVHVDEDASLGVALAAEDVRAFAAAMGRSARLVEGDVPARCVEGELHVVVRGPDDEASLIAPLEDPQGIAVHEERCGGKGSLVETQGASVLAAQWAAYELLERWGVRFFHPEETFVPTTLVLPDAPLEVREAPFLRQRTMNVHRTHPVELSPPLELDDELDMAAHQRRWVDWCIRNKHTGASGWDREHIGTYAWDRGLPRGAGVNLLNTQQGGRPVIDPDDPRPEEEQIEDAIVAALAGEEGDPPATSFGFQFNPSEFTEADPTDTVRRLTFIADWFAANRPDILPTTINHGTHGEPVFPYDVRFFDLSMFAPENLGVRVHTLMFYDLVRDAPVYGNESFRFLYRFTRREAERRRIIHYPESSWWLTFDLPVPLFLAPVTVENRAVDLDVLADLASPSDDSVTGLYGHHLFTSGQEWGYWIIDWCFSRQSWRREKDGARACFDELARAIGPGGELVRDTLLDVARRQNVEMRDREIVRFLVGSDDETEIAAAAGIDFHPLPPAPSSILGLSDDGAARLEQASLAPLRAMAAAYARDAASVGALLGGPLDDDAARIVRELRDGLEITGLRAAHAVTVYETALALRAALAAGSLAAIDEAYEGVVAARALTEAARAVVKRREGDYRYPDALSIAGDEPGTPGAIENRTIYPYRVLSRTHRLFYWTRPDDQLAALFGEGLELVRPSRRVLTLGTALDVQVVADEVSALAVAWGDGEDDDALTHTYDAQGAYAWTLDATTSSGAIHHEDEAFVVERRMSFRKGRLRVLDPPGAAAIEGLLPGAVVGLGRWGDADRFVFGAVEETVDEQRAVVAARGKVLVRARDGLSSGPADLSLTLTDIGAVNVYDAVLSVALDESRPDGVLLTIDGTMVIDEIVALLVGVGGFDPEGARELIASLLDYTPETLPDEVPFTLEADGFEIP